LNIASEALKHPYFEDLREKDEMIQAQLKADISKSKPQLKSNHGAHPAAKFVNQARKQEESSVHVQMNQSPSNLEKTRFSSKYFAMKSDASKIQQKSSIPL
jgi:hypothetical protein